MEELIKQVVSKTGISEEQARTAVTTVLGFVKDRLPAPIASQVDNALSGQGGVSSTLSDIASKAGGILS